MKGHKRKTIFATVTVLEERPSKTQKLTEALAATAVSAPAAVAATADEPTLKAAEENTSAAPAVEVSSQEIDKPDDQCMAMFGDLNLYG